MITIYQATIEHKHGYDVSIFSTKEELDKYLEDYCTSHWDEVVLGEMPEDPKEIVYKFFKITEENSFPEHLDWDQRTLKVTLETDSKQELLDSLIETHEARRKTAFGLDKLDPRYVDLQYEFLLGATAVLDFLSGDKEQSQIWPIVMFGLMSGRGAIEKKDDGKLDWTNKINSSDIYILHGYTAVSIYNGLDDIKDATDEQLEEMNNGLVTIESTLRKNPVDLITEALNWTSESGEWLILNEEDADHILYGG